jgi:hypothetical protein
MICSRTFVADQLGKDGRVTVIRVSIIPRTHRAQARRRGADPSHLQGEANKWEEQHFLGEDEDAEIEYGAARTDDAFKPMTRLMSAFSASVTNSENARRHAS